jgi:hypothetical protein
VIIEENLEFCLADCNARQRLTPLHVRIEYLYMIILSNKYAYYALGKHIA